MEVFPCVLPGLRRETELRIFKSLESGLHGQANVVFLISEIQKNLEVAEPMVLGESAGTQAGAKVSGLRWVQGPGAFRLKIRAGFWIK